MSMTEPNLDDLLKCLEVAKDGYQAAVDEIATLSRQLAEARELLEMAAGHIRDLDGGNVHSETGWRSEESLDIFLRCRGKPGLHTAAMGTTK